MRGGEVAVALAPVEGRPQVSVWVRRPHELRHRGLDGLRGVAMVLMVLDHVLIVTGHGTNGIRYTLTRAAMPLFFVVAGHLVTRWTPRHLGLAVVGVVLPLVVAWIDSPNVLLWYAACAPLVITARRMGPFALAVLVGLSLTLAANGWDLWESSASYDPLALLALMSLGALLPRAAFDFANWVPVPVVVLGRYPVTVYVGHLLVLVAVRSVLA